MFAPFSGTMIIVLVVIFIVGTRRACKVLNDNPALRGAAKRGGISLWRLLK